MYLWLQKIPMTLITITLNFVRYNWCRLWPNSCWYSIMLLHIWFTHDYVLNVLKVKVLLTSSGVARTFPGGRVAHPEGQNEAENKYLSIYPH